MVAMDSSPHVLVVDDDREIRDLVAKFLTRHGCRATTVADGKEMRRALADLRIDLVVLDLMLPGEDGLSLCRRLRAESDLPVIMLTAMREDIDRILGLELGADDYLPKPFNPRELLARIRAVLRRTAVPDPPGRRPFRSGGLEIDFDTREVTADGRRAILTHYEFELLATLARVPGRVLSREQLLDALKGQDADAFDRS